MVTLSEGIKLRPLLTLREGAPFLVEVELSVKYCSYMSCEFKAGVKILQVGVQNI
jgi:hypothetical protein